LTWAELSLQANNAFDVVRSTNINFALGVPQRSARKILFGSVEGKPGSPLILFHGSCGHIFTMWVRRLAGSIFPAKNIFMQTVQPIRRRKSMSLFMPNQAILE